MSKISITLAVPTIGVLHHKGVESILSVMGSGLISAVNIVPRLPVHQARRRLVETTKTSHILFADDDMIYDATSLAKLIKAMGESPEKIKVVSGLANKRTDKGIVPVVFDKYLKLTTAFNKNEVSRVGGVTLAFTLIDMKVFNIVGTEFNFRTNAGEDIDFNDKLRKAGIPVYLEPRAKIGHLTDKIL